MPTTRGGKSSSGKPIELAANTNVISASEGEEEHPTVPAAAAGAAVAGPPPPPAAFMPTSAAAVAAAAAAAAAASAAAAGSADHLNAAGASNANYNNQFMPSAMPYGNPFLGHNFPQFPFGIGYGTQHAAYSMMPSFYPNHDFIKPPSFNGDKDKFNSWKIKIKDHFMNAGLLDVLTADVPDADKDRRVYSMLLRCLDGEPLHIVDREANGSGKKAFNCLITHNLGNSNARKITAINKLFSIHKLENETLSSYIGRLQDVRKVLSEFNYFPDDSVYILKALHGLPESYDTFKTVINKDLEELTWEKFREQILNLILMKTKPSETEQATVMNIKADNPNISVQKPPKKNMKFAA